MLSVMYRAATHPSRECAPVKIQCISFFFLFKFMMVNFALHCNMPPCLWFLSFCITFHALRLLIFPSGSNIRSWGTMGNTSDRVAGDRHGAKAHRSDSGGHKDHEPSSKMVDSTDDPNIFNTHGPESKVLLSFWPLTHTWSLVGDHVAYWWDAFQASGEKEFTPDLENLVKTGPQARPTVIRWAGGGKEVYISGSFNNWSTKIPLNKR